MVGFPCLNIPPFLHKGGSLTKESAVENATDPIPCYCLCLSTYCLIITITVADFPPSLAYFFYSFYTFLGEKKSFLENEVSHNFVVNLHWSYAPLLAILRYI